MKPPNTQNYKSDLWPSLAAITYGTEMFLVPTIVYGTCTRFRMVLHNKEKMPALSPRTFTSPSVSSLHFALKKMHFFTTYTVGIP
jgi:hypothetical protein